MVPIPRRASSFLVVVFIHVNGKEEEGETEQFTKGCNILHRLQVYHLTLTVGTSPTEEKEESGDKQDCAGLSRSVQA